MSEVVWELIAGAAPQGLPENAINGGMGGRGGCNGGDSALCDDDCSVTLDDRSGVGLGTTIGVFLLTSEVDALKNITIHYKTHLTI